MMYKLIQTSQFKKDIKKILKGNRKDLVLVFDVLEILKLKGVNGIALKMKPHKLKGIFKGNLECHIKPDLLIIWIQIESPGIINLVRLGSHSELFK